SHRARTPPRTRSRTPPRAAAESTLAGSALSRRRVAGIPCRAPSRCHAGRTARRPCAAGRQRTDPPRSIRRRRRSPILPQESATWSAPCRVVQEELEQRELLGRERQLGRVAPGLLGGRIELQVPAGQDDRPRPVIPPGQRPQPGPKLEQAERLAQAVVGASIQATAPVA